MFASASLTVGLHAGGADDALIFVSAADGGTCPHEEPLFILPNNPDEYPIVDPTFVRFSYESSRPKLVARRRFMLHVGSGGGFTAFAHFQRPQKTDATQESKLFTCLFPTQLKIWITTDGLLRAQLTTSHGRVTSTSSRVVADDTDELFAIHFSTAASTLSFLWGPSAVNMTAVDEQVWPPDRQSLSVKVC